MKYRIDVFENKTLAESIPVRNKETVDMMMKNYIELYKDEWKLTVKIYEIEGTKETLINKYPRNSEVS